jgi:hypothetical protein
MTPKVGMRTYQQPQQQQSLSYDDLHEGPIHPSEITKNGTALFNFVKGLAKEISSTEEDEAIASQVSYTGKDMRTAHSIHHSKIHHLERVGNNMARMMNEGDAARANKTQFQNTIKVNLSDLLNADKAFNNLTQGSTRPVIQNNYREEEPKTMSDIDISEYLGGTQQKRPVQQNNTFYVNMDKTSKAILMEQQKTNKILGLLVQSVRDNGLKIDELPQHIAEAVAANNLPDAEIMSEDDYATATASNDIDENLLP